MFLAHLFVKCILAKEWNYAMFTSLNLPSYQTNDYRYVAFVFVNLVHRGTCYQHSPEVKCLSGSWINPLFVTNHPPLNLSQNLG